MQEVVEVKNGAKKQVLKKLFPGYVLLNMIMNDDTWYVVRNTRGVTGFVGPGSKPVPLTEEEMTPLGIKPAELEIDFEEGDTVTITAGVWKDTVGVIQSINPSKQIVTINVELFGRETPVEIGFTEIKKTSGALLPSPTSGLQETTVFYRKIFGSRTTVYRDAAPLNILMRVRCVRDAQKD